MSVSPPPPPTEPPPTESAAAPAWLAGLIAHARAEDGQPPFSDGSLVELAAGARTVISIGEDAAAIASATEAEFVVRPDARGAGIGTTLLVELLRRSPDGLLLWAHGDHPAARALARGHDLSVVRTLLHLVGPVPEPPIASVELPTCAGVAAGTPTQVGNSTHSTGFEVAAFRPGVDDAAWLALNARAFATHPEQGRVTQADLDTLMAEPWFDAENFLLLRDETGQLAGYCWLKVDGGRGEFYVVGVDPSRQGAGLGRRLLEAGFARLAARDIHEAHLYVEADNEPAVKLYRSFGFVDDTVDVQYRSAARA